MKRILSAVALALSLATSATAGVATYDATTNILRMEGMTDKTLRDTTLRALQLHGDEIELIEMSGPGGYMSVLPEIVAAVQASGLPVMIPQGARCASACAFAAIAADTVLVQGHLMFHMSFISGYPMDATLHDILNHGQGNALDVTELLASMGFKQDFTAQLIKRTAPSQWFVVSNIYEIKDCRMTGDSLAEFMEPCIIDAPNMSSTEARNFMAGSPNVM
jgi:hypothetical protein